MKHLIIGVIVITMLGCTEDQIKDEIQEGVKQEKQDDMGKQVDIPSNSPFQPETIETNGSLIGDITQKIYDDEEQDVISFIVNNITTTRIRNVLGDSVNIVPGLCQSNKINPYALFRPDGDSPYSMGDFAGYNHYALPPTHYTGKRDSMTREIQLDGTIGNYFDIDVNLMKGERPPELDNNAKRWTRLKVIVTAHFDDVETVTKDVSLTDDYEVALFQVPVPSNDNYNIDVDIETYYMSTDDTQISTIEDSHPTISATLERRYILLEIDDANVSLSNVYHYYTDGSEWERVSQDININSDIEYGYFGSAFSTSYNNKGYAYTIFEYDNTYYLISPSFVEDGDTIELNGTWYEISTNKDNSIVIPSTEEVDGFYTINQDGTLDETNVDY